MGFSTLFINRPIATSLLMVALLLLGLIGFRGLPVSALPDIDAPSLVVTTQYPGASASTKSWTSVNGMVFDVMPSVRIGASAGLTLA